MTRHPTESRAITGLTGPGYEPYTAGTMCANPECRREATDRHHLFSRSLMAGAYDWVRLPEGKEVGNIVGLCPDCHRLVTENRVHITFRPTDNRFCWNGAPLAYQPPGAGQGAIRPGFAEQSVAAEIVERSKCPSCGRRMPKPKEDKEKDEEKRPRKTWSVAVPFDQQENGAEVIDELLDAAEEAMDKYGLNWGHGSRVAYFKLTTALALFVTHADEILGGK